MSWSWSLTPRQHALELQCPVEEAFSCCLNMLHDSAISDTVVHLHDHPPDTRLYAGFLLPVSWQSCGYHFGHDLLVVLCLSSSSRIRKDKWQTILELFVLSADFAESCMLLAMIPQPLVF
jgi:hypothetical protein